MKNMKSLKSSTVLALLFLLVPHPAFASHLSGGENDLMGLYGGAALTVGFVGLLGILGLVPRRWRQASAQWGKWLLAVGVVILVAGGYHVAVLGKPEERLGDLAFGRMAAQQLIGTLAVFGLFSGAAYYFGKRSGILDMGEAVKYTVMRNGDPADRTATRVARPGEQRLMLIPFVAMGVLALSFTAGVLIVMLRLR